MDLYENLVAYQTNLVVTGTWGRANPEAEEDGQFTFLQAHIEIFIAIDTWKGRVWCRCRWWLKEVVNGGLYRIY